MKWRFMNTSMLHKHIQSNLYRNIHIVHLRNLTAISVPAVVGLERCSPTECNSLTKGPKGDVYNIDHLATMQCSAGNSWVLPFTDRLHPLKTAACGMVLNLSPSQQNLHRNGPRNLWEINHSTSNPFRSCLTTQRPCVHGYEPFWPCDVDLRDIRQTI